MEGSLQVVSVGEGNMVVSIAGDFSQITLKEEAEKWLG